MRAFLATSFVALTTVTATMAATAMEPSVAQACSPPCDGLTPLGTEAAPVHLPANGVFVVPPYTSSTEFVVVRTRGGASETLTYPFAYAGIRLTDVEPGDRLEVSVMSSCAGGMTTTVIDVTPAAPIPTQLGVLEVEASRPMPVAVWDNRGACTSDLASTVAPYTVTHDPSIEPWRDALIETVFVDDAPWGTVRDPRIASRFVFTACEPRLESQMGGPDLPVGAHRLRIEGSLRGLEGTFPTNETPFELHCTAASAGCSATPSPRPLDGGWALCVAAVALTLVRARVRRAG